ncbi:MAG: ParB/RepB/Spo0J family partition protein [Clostridia bacterium]|nr:ParB/RepB/Spo0J family partition protein [Clostridia bacterium]
MIEIDYTNEVLMNHYKKQEIKKAKERLAQKKTKAEILKLADERFITADEIKEALGFEFIEDPEPVKEQEHVVDEVDYVIEDEDNQEVVKYEKEENITATLIEDSELEDYPNQPFKLYDKEKRNEMIESIRINGIMQPLIVRPIDNGKYQILAGHNRRSCARELGITKYPCIIKKNLTDDEAKIYLIDTNLCTRDKISPMERARAYKIKYDTYKKRNINTSMFEEIKKDNEGALNTLIKEEKTSAGSIQRYLRLMYLVPSLQDLVDKGKISLTVGEKLSFLPNEEQKFVAEIIKDNVKINDGMAQKIRKESERNKREDYYNFLMKEDILDLIKSKKKSKDDEQDYVCVKFYRDEIDRYFGVVNDINDLKRQIIYSLEETYIKN